MIGSVVQSIVGAIISALTGASTAFERITNGGFDSGDSWTITSAKWSIAAGVASELGTGNGLNQTIAAIASGTPWTFSCDVGGTPQGLEISLTSGGVVTDVLYSGLPLGATISESGTTTASADGIRIESYSAGSATVDNVSLIA